MSNIMYQPTKKQIITLVILIGVVLLGGFAVYYFMPTANEDAQNTENAENQDTPDTQVVNPLVPPPSVQLESGGITAEGTSGESMLIACVDSCGDGVCKNTGPDCNANTLNCVCPENPQSCPEDCR